MDGRNFIYKKVVFGSSSASITTPEARHRRPAQQVRIPKAISQKLQATKTGKRCRKTEEAFIPLTYNSDISATASSTKIDRSSIDPSKFNAMCHFWIVVKRCRGAMINPNCNFESVHSTAKMECDFVRGAWPEACPVRGNPDINNPAHVRKEIMREYNCAECLYVIEQAERDKHPETESQIHKDKSFIAEMDKLQEDKRREDESQAGKKA